VGTKTLVVGDASYLVGWSFSSLNAGPGCEPLLQPGERMIWGLGGWSFFFLKAWRQGREKLSSKRGLEKD